MSKSVAFLSSLCEGNGVEPGQFREDGVETAAIPLRARLRATLSADVEKAGRKPGPVPAGSFPSHQAAQAEIDKLPAAFAADKAVKDEICRLLDARAGHGWGMKDERVLLTAGRKSFKVAQSCKTCGGAGASACLDCRGTGQVACQFCYGQGCEKCGDGKTAPCGSCQASGRVGCKPCAGSGQEMETLNVACRAAFHFECDDPADPVAAQALTVLGLRDLVGAGHVEARRGEPQAEKAQITLPFETVLPVSRLSFRVGGKPQTAVVAGLKETLVAADPFLDPLVKPGIAALLRLTRGGFAMRALLTTACKYKMVRRALILTGGHSKAFVRKALVAEYPLILSDKYARALAHHAASALLVLTRGPRRSGLVFGLVFSALVAGGYLIAGGRPLVPPRFLVAADAGLGIFTFAVTVFWIKLSARNALARLLKLGAGRKPPLQHAGAEGWAALPLLLCVWGAAVAVMRHPEWVAAAKALVIRQ